MMTKQINMAKAVAIASPVYIVYGTSFIHSEFWSSSPTLIWGEWLFFIFFLPAMCLLLMHKVAGVRSEQYGVFVPTKQFRKDEFAAWTLITAIAFLSYIVIYSIVSLYVDDSAYGTQQVGPPHSTGWGGVLIILLTACVVGMFEEIFFRGVLGMFIAPVRTNGLRKSIFVIVSSLLFGMEHVAAGIPNFIATVYMGVVAAILYLALKNLWPLIIAHAITIAFVDLWRLLK